jgi:uncharacterized protein with FMN-binding domain
MRRFISVLIATVAGLVVLLSFKTTQAKAPRPVALSSATPGASAAAPDSSSPVSSAPVSSAPDSSVPASSLQPPTAPPTSSVATAPSAPSAAKTSPAPTKSAAKPTPKPTPKPTAKPTPTPSSTTKTVTGSAVTVSEGRRVFGVVQVRLTLTNGKITASTAIQFPDNDGHSLDLSNYSIPKLSREVLSAQSASIDAVSSATYTSEAYAQSVQAALDAAKA